MSLLGIVTVLLAVHMRSSAFFWLSVMSFDLWWTLRWWTIVISNLPSGPKKHLGYLHHFGPQNFAKIAIAPPHRTPMQLFNDVTKIYISGMTFAQLDEVYKSLCSKSWCHATMAASACRNPFTRHKQRDWTWPGAHLLGNGTCTFPALPLPHFF